MAAIEHADQSSVSAHHESPGLVEWPDVPTERSLAAIERACGRFATPGSLRFTVVAPMDGVDDWFHDADRVARTIHDQKTASLKSRFNNSRIWRHSRMTDALPLLADDLGQHCDKLGLGILALTIRFSSVDDMVGVQQGSGLLSDDSMWHTDLTLSPPPLGEPRDMKGILRDDAFDQKFGIGLTIVRGDEAVEVDNSTQGVRGLIDITAARVCKTIRELNCHERDFPHLVAVDEWGMPIYVPNEMIDESMIHTVGERVVGQIPKPTVHRVKSDLTIPPNTAGRVVLSGYLIKKS